jgi:putative pyruvate formate lyase activating enzyme
MDDLKNCKICPRNCGVNRYVSKGSCGAGDRIRVNLWQKHFGEEPVISGTKGSGTIFFSNCNLKCVYCQNYQISQEGWGEDYSNDEVLKIFNKLEESDVHNINLVTPTHFTSQLFPIIKDFKAKSKLPIVWNTNSYEKVESLKKIENLVDIYLSDLKYFEPNNSKKYSFSSDYFDYASTAILEMYRQVGNLKLDKKGIAKKGLIIRLLVLPNNSNRIDKILHWIYKNFGKDVYISVMAQYYPTFKADKFEEINRGITEDEYEGVLQLIEEYGFKNAFIQEVEQSPEWTPKFINIKK